MFFFSRRKVESVSVWKSPWPSYGRSSIIDLVSCGKVVVRSQAKHLNATDELNVLAEDSKMCLVVLSCRMAAMPSVCSCSACALTVSG